MHKARYAVLILLIAGCATQTSNAPTSSAPTTGEPASAGKSPPGQHAEVVRVFDGDSLIVKLDDGSEAEVRLLGINAPEGSECHGDAARQTLQQLLESGPITLVSDTEESDQFDRLLRYIYIDDLNVNLAMIANGDAIVLQGDHSLDVDFVAIADAAAAASMGLWAPDACGDEAAPTAVAIVDYIYNPRGRDEDDLNGEWVAIANDGDQTVDVAGWTLRDESTQNRYQFPNGFSLNPGAEVLVHVGCGNDTATDLHWCAQDPVWSNGGDTAILQSPSGTVMSRQRYDGDY